MTTTDLLWIGIALISGLFVNEFFSSARLRKQLIREMSLNDLYLSIGNEALKQLEMEKSKNHELSLEINSLKQGDAPKS